MFRAVLCACAMALTATGQTAGQAAQSRRAKELMAQGRFADAVPIYNSLVEQVPGNTGLLLNLAMAETMSGQARQAIPHCRSVLERDAQSIPALTMLSMAELQLNQPAQAVGPLKKLVDLNPGNVDARGMLAGAEMSLSDFGDAAQQYTRLTSLVPADAKAWYGLGKAYEGLASDSFAKLLKAAPQSAYVAVLLGESRLQQRQFRSAFFFYREAQKQMPNLAGVHSGLAAVYDGTAHNDWAATEKEREAALATSCGPASANEPCLFARAKYSALANAKAVTPAALFWATRASNQLALEAFRQLGKMPESAELHVLKAQILHDHKQDLEAAKEWQAALAMTPAPGKARLETELATAYFLGRDYAKAIPSLEKLLQGDEQSPDLNFMLGESLWRAQQGDRAVAYLQKAIALRPEMLPAHADLGLVLLSLNKPNDAAAHLEKAQTLDEDGSLHYSLARAYQAAGNAGKARKNMEVYREIQKRNSEANGQLAKEAEITAPP